MLFCYPEHLQIWNPAFNTPVTAALDKYAKDIEKELGLNGYLV